MTTEQERDARDWEAHFRAQDAQRERLVHEAYMLANHLLDAATAILFHRYPGIDDLGSDQPQYDRLQRVITRAIRRVERRSGALD